MAGVQYEVDFAGLASALDAFSAMESLNRSEALSIASAIAISGTRERLRETKEAPDGTPWADWSEEYAATRHGGHSLLQNTGSLDDSLNEFQSGATGGVSTNLVYAAIHQFGGADVGKDIPARPYLGLSDEEAAEIVFELEDWLARKVGAAQ